MESDKISDSAGRIQFYLEANISETVEVTDSKLAGGVQSLQIPPVASKTESNSFAHAVQLPKCVIGQHLLKELTIRWLFLYTESLQKIKYFFEKIRPHKWPTKANQFCLTVKMKFLFLLELKKLDRNMKFMV